MAIRIFSNAWVKPRRADEISALAVDLRERAGLRDVENLNVVDMLRKLERTDIPGKGRLRVKVYPEKPNGYLAYVSFRPLELHVDRLVFERARWNADTHAKYVLAHEIGHVRLHDQLAVPFSEKDTGHRTRGTEETQAEWQADCFADCLLVPDHIASRFCDAKQIVNARNVDAALSERRVMQRQSAKKFQSVYEGEFCAGCGNASLVRRGFLLECDNCGESFSGLSV